MTPLAAGALHYKLVSAQMSRAFGLEHSIGISVLYYIPCEEKLMTWSGIFLRSSLVCLQGMHRAAYFCEHHTSRQQQAVFWLTNLPLCFPGKQRPPRLCPAALCPAHKPLSSLTPTSPGPSVFYFPPSLLFQVL